MAWNPRSWAMQKRKLGLLGLLPRIGHAPSVGGAQGDIGDFPGMLQGWREKLFPGGTLHNFPGPDPLPPRVPFFPHDAEPGRWSARPGIISKEPTYPWLIHRDPVVRGENVPSVPAIIEKPPMQKTYPNTGPPGWAPKASAQTPTAPFGGGIGKSAYQGAGLSTQKKGLSLKNMINAMSKLKAPTGMDFGKGSRNVGGSRPTAPSPRALGVDALEMASADDPRKKWWKQWQGLMGA